MPSRTPDGKRLSGAEQRRRAAENAQAGTAPAPRKRGGAAKLRVDPPPRGQGLDALVAWAARVQLAAAGLSATGLQPERVRAVQHVVRAIGSVKHSAADSERACRALARFGGVVVVYDEPTPPKDDAGLMAWVAWRLADLLYHAATTERVDELAVAQQAAALRAIEKVAPQAAIDAVADRFRDEKEGA